MSNNKDYFVRIENKLVSVDRDTYFTYYKAKRQERYHEERDLANRVVSYDALDTDEIIGEEMIYDLEATSVEDIIVQKIMIEKLKHCLEKLSEDEQWLILELFYHGKSERTLSDETGIPQKTINNRRRRILEKLKKLIKS